MPVLQCSVAWLGSLQARDDPCCGGHGSLRQCSMLARNTCLSALLALHCSPCSVPPWQQPTANARPHPSLAATAAAAIGR